MKTTDFSYSNLRSLHILSAVDNIAKLFSENKIKFILLKGVGLSQRLYGEPLKRKSNDIDIFIDKNDIYKVFNLLAAKKIFPKNDISNDRLFILMKTRKSTEFVYQNSNFQIDLHWSAIDILYGSFFDFNQLYRRSRTIFIGTQSYSILSATDELLFLSIHGTIHRFSQKKWIKDIDRLISDQENANDRINWIDLLTNAKTLKVVRELELAISLAQRFYNTSVPQKFLYQLGVTDSIQEKVISIHNDFLESEGDVIEEKSLISKLFWRLSFIKLFSDKIQYLWALIFYPSEKDLVFSEIRADFFYFIFRPLRLIFTYVLSINIGREMSFKK